MIDIFMRELGIFELLRVSAALFIRNLKYIIPLCMLVFIPLYVIEFFVPDVSAGLFSDPFLLTDSSYSDVWALYLNLLIRMCFTSLAAGGFTYMAFASLTGRKVGGAGVMDYSIMKLPRLFLTGALVFAITMLSSVFIFPIFYFAVAFAFWQNIAASSSEWGLKALARSAAIVRGRFFKCLLYMLCFSLINTVASVLLGALLPAVYPAGAASIVGGVIYVAFNAVIETFLSLFTFVQAVWFVNLISVPKKTAGK